MGNLLTHRPIETTAVYTRWPTSTWSRTADRGGGNYERNEWWLQVKHKDSAPLRHYRAKNLGTIVSTINYRTTSCHGAPKMEIQT